MYKIWLFCIICPDFYYLANILMYINSLLISNFCFLTSTLTNTKKVYLFHLANTLIITNNIAKVDFCHLVNVLTSINNVINYFIKEEIGCV